MKDPFFALLCLLSARSSSNSLVNCDMKRPKTFCLVLRKSQSNFGLFLVDSDRVIGDTRRLGRVGGEGEDEEETEFITIHRNKQSENRGAE